MTELNRRSFVAISAGGVSALCIPPSLAAACEEYVTGSAIAYPPDRLTVDGASVRNLQIFQQNADHLGLAGVVSTEPVTTSLGSYPAGNMFLFPWIKDEGQGRAFPAVVPASMTQFGNASPIPNADLPVEEYLCRIVLQAPYTSFIGFQVDKPFAAAEARLPWFTNVTDLADGKSAGIGWASSNLNHTKFGGSTWIPDSEEWYGKAWRGVIVAGLRQASIGVS